MWRPQPSRHGPSYMERIALPGDGMPASELTPDVIEARKRILGWQRPMANVHQLRGGHPHDAPRDIRIKGARVGRMMEGEMTRGLFSKAHGSNRSWHMCSE